MKNELIACAVVAVCGITPNIIGYGYYFWNKTHDSIEVHIGKRACAGGCCQSSGVFPAGKGYRFDTGPCCLDSYEIYSSTHDYSLKGGPDELGGDTGLGMRCADGELTVMPDPNGKSKFIVQTGKH